MQAKMSSNEVESIYGHRQRNGVTEYRIKWKDSDETTWNSHSASLTDVIDAYEARFALQIEPEQILRKQKTSRRIEYLVRWADGWLTWETKSNDRVTDLAVAYDRQTRSMHATNSREQRKVNGNENPAKRVKRSDNVPDLPQITEFKVCDDIHCIHDMRRIDGSIFFLVEYRGHENLEWVPKHIVRRNAPQKTIQFYEKCIRFD